MFEKYAHEWAPTGEFYPSGGMSRAAAQPKRHFPITERENIKRVLDGKKPVYIPVTADMTAFAPRIIPDNRVRAWAIEADPIPPGTDVGIGPDMFGAIWEYVPVTGGSMVRGDEALIKDITRWEEYVTFPDLDTWDWAGSAESNKQYLKESESRLTRIWIMTGLNERLISLLNFVNTMTAYIDEDQKAGVHRFYDKLCTFYDDLIDKFRKYYNADILMFNDDWGTQRSPQFSPDIAREMLMPYIKRLVDSCHKRGMYFELHCCGKNDMLAPVIAESGVDMWIPQEINDMELIYKLIGDKVLLGIPANEKTEMTDEECLESAREFMDKYGKYGHVLYAPVMAGTTNPKMKEYMYYLSREAYEAF